MMLEDKQPPGAAVGRLDDVTDALADLAEVLGRDEDLGRVLQSAVDQIAGTVPGADMASVTVLRGDAGETVASTAERVWAIDSDQYAAGDGPCLEAARTGQVVRTETLQARERWPKFARSAEAAGVASYLSCPLMIGEEFAGSLNLYSTQPHGFTDFDVALLRLYITAACAAIATSNRYARARDLAGHLGQALGSRAVIDQAIGVLMARRGLSEQEAFQELAHESQNTNTKLRVIAAQVVESVRRPGP